MLRDLFIAFVVGWSLVASARGATVELVAEHFKHHMVARLVDSTAPFEEVLANVAVSVHESSAAGTVTFVDTQATYEGWSFDFPGTSVSTSVEVPIGLGLGQLAFDITFDPWSFEMDGPVVTTLTQPRAHQFSTEGLSGVDFEFGLLSGSWSLQGPNEGVSGDWSYQPVETIGDGHWSLTFLDEDDSPWRVLGEASVPGVILWEGILEGRELRVEVTRSQAAGTIEIPEPPTMAIMLIGFAVFALAAVSVWTLP